jgi:hypothetical protein
MGILPSSNRHLSPLSPKTFGFTKNLVLRPTSASSAKPPHFDMDAGGRQRQLLLFQLACL